MSSLIPYTPNPIPLPTSAVVPSSWSSSGRAMRSLVARTELEVAGMVAEAHVADAEIDAIDQVTQRAMQGVTMIAQLEGQLNAAVPAASFRLAQIGQAHANAMANEVTRFVRRVQR